MVRTANPTIRNPHSAIRFGFTLVEVMISVAIALILLVGVNQVFDTAGRTITAGNAVNEITRNGRAMQSLLASDFRNMTTDGPLMVLHSRAAWAYRSEADSKTGYTSGAYAGAKFFDEDNNGTIDASDRPLSFTDYNFRRHRLDVISFFVRDLYRRQTGNDGVWVAPQAGTEGWVWYGHLKLPNNANPVAYRLPWDSAPNENNQYASQWTLGRVAMLLQETDASGRIFDRNNTQQWYIGRGSGASATSLAPLSISSRSMLDTSTSDPNVLIQYCRYDVAGYSNSGYRQILNSALWPAWSSTTSYAADARAYHRGLFWKAKTAHSNQEPPVLGTTSSYWELLDFAGASFMGTERFQCNPYFAKPIDSAAAAKYVPYLAAACSQFVVEYAGDFVSQDGSTGNVTGTCWDYATGAEKATDGQIDFVINAAGQRSIRWYGLPRNIDGTRAVSGYVVGRTASQMPDVVPLRDIWQTYAATERAPFERNLPAAADDYSTAAVDSPQYVCAWTPYDRKPKMIRILMAFDDPAGNIQNPVWFEYVYTLP